MAKPQVTQTLEHPLDALYAVPEPGTFERAHVVSPDEEDERGVEFDKANDELQSEIEAQRAFDGASSAPSQPYVLESSAFKADLLKRKAVLDNDIAVLEGQRNGMNARIDDMNYTRNAVDAALATLK